MDKDTIVAEARRLTDAAEQAQQWIARNEERVRSCGKSREDVLAKLRQQARLLRKLGRAAERKMCAGVFGPSQAGKSYLLSSLARDENKEVRCAFGDQTYDFLRDLNPGGNKESTGLVTRFTMTPPANMPAGYPVHVRLLSETELVKIFANSYFCDCDHKEKVDKTAIQAAVSSLKERAGQPCAHITLDVMEELREYVSNSFGGMSRAAALEEVYWRDAIALAPRLSLDDRVKLFGIIWDGIPEFNDMFQALSSDLARLGNAEEAFCSMDALVPREASIIDVDTLGRTDFSLSHVSGEVQMCTPEGRKAAVSRKNASAVIAELTLVMTHKPADYFDHTDLLDFPGYKARLECSDIRDYLHKGRADSAVEQFFRRGKVAYLFQRYNAERELTSLLLCVATTDNTPGLPAAVEEWITATHGKTPEDRVHAKTALFYILTKSDHHFEEKSGAKFETRWDDVVKGVFLGHFSGAYSQNTRWVEEWTPNQPFNNLYMLRNVNIRWDNMMTYNAEGRETGVREDKEQYRDELRKAFIESALVQRHFRSPATAFDEIMNPNDGGIEHIKRCLQPLCDPNLKLGQISNALYAARQTLYATLAPFYHSGNQEEELKKKMALFGRFGKLFMNPNFQERFPELLNNFKISPEQLYYLYSEAERSFDEYRESSFSMPEEAESAPEADTLDMSDVDPLDFFDEPAPAAPGKKEPSPADKDELSFYAERIIEAWSMRMRSLADTTECTSYYLFPKTIFLAVLDEFDAAVARLNIEGRLENKFREIAQPVDVPKESKIRKQASYAIGVLNDFVSWMGKKPAESNESQRVVNYRGQNVTVFRDKPQITGYPVLPETFKPFVKQWYKDWLTTFYGILVDNVTFTDGLKINLEENAKLGRIINQINGEQASA